MWRPFAEEFVVLKRFGVSSIVVRCVAFVVFAAIAYVMLGWPVCHAATSDPPSTAAHGGLPAGHVPEDRVDDDPAVAEGSIAISLRDAEDKPVRNRPVVVGSVTTSVANGESHNHLEITTDSQGEAIAHGLEIGGHIAYRVTEPFDGATFHSAPFRLPTGRGVRVVLHVFNVTHDESRAGIYFDMTVAVELREDRFQLDEAINVYNLSPLAWVPVDVRIPVPPSVSKFHSQTSMNDQMAVESDGNVVLKGTYPPGRHLVVFGWQIPWTGDNQLSLLVESLPRTYAARVLTPEARGLRLAVDGFLPPETRDDGQGRHLLVSERRWQAPDGRGHSVHITLSGLPSLPAGRWVSVVLSIALVGSGLGYAVAHRTSNRGAVGSASRRSAVLQALVELERARSRGDVGPHTYERSRERLLDLLAGALARA